MSKRAGIGLVLVSAIAYGGLAIVARYAFAAGVNTSTLMLVRFAICATFLSAIWAVRRTPMPDRRTAIGLLAAGSILYVIQSYCFFTSLTLIDASLTSLILYTYPAVVTLGAVVFQGERLSGPKALALALATLGLLLTIGKVRSGNPAGIALAAGAALAYSAYILIAAKLSRNVAVMPSAALIVLGSLAGYVVLAPIQGMQLPHTANGWVAMIGVAVLTIIAITSMLSGMSLVGPVATSTLSVIEPVVTVGLAALLFRERLHLLQILGGALILSAAVVLSVASPEHVAPPDGVGE